MELNQTQSCVFMCSGQGSQKPGMGADLIDVPEVAQVFDCASDILGVDVRNLCTQAPAEELNETRNAQAAIATLSIGIATALIARGVQPQAVLGFSLGQISALAISGMLSVEDTFRLLAVRSEVMAKAAQQNEGVMSAFMKGTPEEVEEVCASCAQGQVLVPANYNSAAQIVVSGEVAAVERAEAAWKERGYKARRLATSGAFHSPLMQRAASEFSAYLETVQFSDPRVPLICNTDAQPLKAADAPAHLTAHLTHPVRFMQSVQELAAAGATSFVEVGFGGVLNNLVKRIDPNLDHVCVQDRASMEALIQNQA